MVGLTLTLTCCFRTCWNWMVAGKSLSKLSSKAWKKVNILKSTYFKFLFKLLIIMIILFSSPPQLGDHVNVRRPFRSDDRMSRSVCQESSTLSRVESSMSSGRAHLKNGMSTSVLDRCRTIDESLALINHHVQVYKLNTVNNSHLFETVRYRCNVRKPTNSKRIYSRFTWGSSWNN